MTQARPYFQFSSVEQESLLLVEGNDDARFFRAFLRWLNLTGVQIAVVGDVNQFAPFLANTLIRDPEFPRLRKLALVRDADLDPHAAFRSLQGAISRAGLPFPAEPYRTTETGLLSVSIAILPDGSSRGNLEDLCLRSIQDGGENSAALDCVERYLDCRGVPPGAESGQTSKARLHSYLAVADEPGRRLGEAADAGVWDWNSTALRPLVDFLRRL